ncbi:hypothetical protein BDW69DRAFT_181419 [Aspergillus filifer]
MHDRGTRLTADPSEPEDPMYLPYVNEDGSIPNGLQLPADMMPALDRLGMCCRSFPAGRHRDFWTGRDREWLHNIMENAEAVLWVTSGAARKDPDANIAVGLSSTLRAERMDLRLQFLDLDDDDEDVSVEPILLVDTLLRLAVLGPSQADQLLWTQEPELALKGGALYVPRVQLFDRQSSIRREAPPNHSDTQA